MNLRLLSFLNAGVAALICIFILASGFLWITGTADIVCSDPEAKQCHLPQGAFTLSTEAYESIGEPLLALESAPPSIQIPDLRTQLIYYGKNGRPDAQAEYVLLHFGINGTKHTASITPDEKLYFIFDKTQTPHKYIFSPNNAPTSLWMQATSNSNETSIKVTMLNERGEDISEPENFANFKLPEKEALRQTGTTWEIEGMRVDGTLLARQKARWYGPDKFLEKHGGEEYKDILGKERIEFGEEDKLYYVFAGPGESMVWKEGRWQNTTPGKETLSCPLLYVKKIDERIMTFELWDIDGKGKVLLNILKSQEPWLAQNSQIIQNSFKFVGARTRSQYVFEVNQERLLVSPQEWILFSPQDGWRKLQTAKDIDDYVYRRTTGALFVFDGLAKENEQQMIKGTLFSPSRSDMKEIELPVQSKASTARNEKDNDTPEKADQLKQKQDVNKPPQPK